MMSKGVDWTPQLDARMRELYDRRLTFLEISRILNADFGLKLTRNSCIGRARRLKFPLRDGSPPPPPPKSRRVRKQYPKKKRQVRMAELPPVPWAPPPLVPGALTMLQLTHDTCRWPSGTRPPYTYCGAPVHDGRSFCLAHCQLAYDKPKKMWS